MWRFSDQPPMPYSKIGKFDKPPRQFWSKHREKFPEGFGNRYTRVEYIKGKKVRVKSGEWEENINGISMMLIRETFEPGFIAELFGCPLEFVEIVRDTLKATNVRHYGHLASLYDLWHVNYLESVKAFDTIMNSSPGKDTFGGVSDVDEGSSNGTVKQSTLAFLKGLA